jgi:hypothetical protein
MRIGVRFARRARDSLARTVTECAHESEMMKNQEQVERTRRWTKDENENATKSIVVDQ